MGGYDIICEKGEYWIVGQVDDVYWAGPFLTLNDAERELAAYEYTEPPENDLEP